MTAQTDHSRRYGKVGVWAVQFRFGDPGFIRESVAELEELGYGTLWFPGGFGGDVKSGFIAILDASTRIKAASGIVNIWMHEPAELGAWWREFSDSQRERVLLGLGVGHALNIGEAWKQPLAKMASYLDGLDAVGLPVASRCIAALGPKMLDLARDRSAGAHPYLVTPEHTAMARDRVGPSALLAPEQGVILDADADSARSKAREHLKTYMPLPNYHNSWIRMGFAEDEILQMSDRFVDALFAWGTPEQIARRVRAHLDAGADHVCLQVVSGSPGMNDPAELRESWRALAPKNIGLA